MLWFQLILAPAVFVQAIHCGSKCQPNAQNVHMCLLDRTVSLCMSILFNLWHQSGWACFFNTLWNMQIFVCNICGCSVRWLRSGLDESIWQDMRDGGQRTRSKLSNLPELYASKLLTSRCCHVFQATVRRKRNHVKLNAFDAAGNLQHEWVMMERAGSSPKRGFISQRQMTAVQVVRQFSMQRELKFQKFHCFPT